LLTEVFMRYFLPAIALLSAIGAVIAIVTS
jgi:hypothetical protein